MKINVATFLSLVAMGTLAVDASAQGSIPGQQQAGPVIQSTGMSIKVENPTFVAPANHVFKALWNINTGSGDSVKVNEQLTVMARFYNLHARHGYAEDRVKTAAVIHGSAWSAVLNDSAFAARYGGKPNPSRRLVEELLQHGAQIVLCGQTAGSRGVKREELLPGVKVAISAMTAFNVLQSDGYLYNPW